jgi:hypothetical protein
MKADQPPDERVDALRRNPALLAAVVGNPGGALDGRLILALKALRFGRRGFPSPL